MKPNVTEPGQVQHEIADLTEVLAGVTMDHYTRYLVDEHLRNLTKDAECGVLLEKRAQELEELEGEIEDLAWRIRSRY